MAATTAETKRTGETATEALLRELLEQKKADTKLIEAQTQALLAMGKKIDSLEEKLDKYNKPTIKKVYEAATFQNVDTSGEFFDEFANPDVMAQIAKEKNLAKEDLVWYKEKDEDNKEVPVTSGVRGFLNSIKTGFARLGRFNWVERRARNVERAVMGARVAVEDKVAPAYKAVADARIMGIPLGAPVRFVDNLSRGAIGGLLSYGPAAIRPEFTLPKEEREKVRLERKNKHEKYESFSAYLDDLGLKHIDSESALRNAVEIWGKRGLDSLDPETQADFKVIANLFFALAQKKGGFEGYELREEYVLPADKKVTVQGAEEAADGSTKDVTRELALQAFLDQASGTDIGYKDGFRLFDKVQPGQLDKAQRYFTNNSVFVTAFLTEKAGEPIDDKEEDKPLPEYVAFGLVDLVGKDSDEVITFLNTHVEAHVAVGKDEDVTDRQTSFTKNILKVVNGVNKADQVPHLERLKEALQAKTADTVPAYRVAGLTDEQRGELVSRLVKKISRLQNKEKRETGDTVLKARFDALKPVWDEQLKVVAEGKDTSGKSIQEIFSNYTAFSTAVKAAVKLVGQFLDGKDTSFAFDATKDKKKILAMLACLKSATLPFGYSLNSENKAVFDKFITNAEPFGLKLT